VVVDYFAWEQKHACQCQLVPMRLAECAQRSFRVDKFEALRQIAVRVLHMSVTNSRISVQIACIDVVQQGLVDAVFLCKVEQVVRQ